MNFKFSAQAYAAAISAIAVTAVYVRIRRRAKEQRAAAQRAAAVIHKSSFRTFTFEVDGLQLRMLHLAVSAMDAIDAMVYQYMADEGIAGLSISIKGQGVHFQRAWGYHYIKNQSSPVMTCDTRLRTMSITKSITSVAILALVDGGRLSLEDSAVALLTPFFNNRFGETLTCPEWCHTVTIRNLLQHTSSIADRGLREIDPANYPCAGSRRAAFICHHLRGQPDAPDHPPGKQYSYCNIGFLILGRIVEAVDVRCRSYEEYVQEEIFSKCAINGAYMIPASDVTHMHQYHDGYVAKRSGDDDQSLWKLTEVYDALPILDRPWITRDFINYRLDSVGGWVMSVNDLVKFSLMIENGDFLSEPLKSSLNDGTVTIQDGWTMALVWKVREHVRTNSGSFPGSSSCIRIDSGGEVCYAANCNVSPKHKALCIFANEVLAHVQNGWNKT